MISDRPRAAAKPAASRRIRGTLEHHAFTVVSSAGKLLQRPVATALTTAVLAIAFALPAGLLLLLTNVERFSNSFDAAGEVAVFLQDTATRSDAERIGEQLLASPVVLDIEIISPQMALDALDAAGDFGDALAALERNPLPWAVMLKPAPGLPPDAMQALSEQADGIDGVALSQFDMVWLIRFNAMVEASARLVHLITALLVVGALLIVGNTIRLDIENRREEIEIIKMLGGTNGFIRRPFLYTGAWLGALGGLAATLLIVAAALVVRAPVQSLATAYEAQFSVAGLTLGDASALLAVATLVGWLGSWLAVARHLSEIEPG